jgi:SAM-dependent methyltransferase
LRINVADDGEIGFQITRELGDTETRNLERAVLHCPSCSYASGKAELDLQNPDTCETVLGAIGRRKGDSIEWSLPNTQVTEHQLADQFNDRISSLSARVARNAIDNELAQSIFYQRARFGILRYRDLFSHRQLLIALELLDSILKTRDRMSAWGFDEQQVQAICCYLSFSLAYLTDRNNQFVSWDASRKTYKFSPFGFRMFSTAFVETDPVLLLDRWFESTVKALSDLEVLERPGHVRLANAESLPYSDNSIDAIVTHPPYYNNINYTALSKFYWTWESQIHPSRELVFSRENGELWNLSGAELEKCFEKGIENTFRECLRVLKEGGSFCLLLSLKSQAPLEAPIVKIASKTGFNLLKVVPIVASLNSANEQLKPIHLTYNCLVFFQKPGGVEKIVKINSLSLPLEECLLLQSADREREVYKGLVAQFMEKAMTSNTNNFYGNVGNVAGTNHGRMESIQNIYGANGEELVRLIGSIKTHVENFPAEQREDALLVVEDLEGDLEKPEKQNPERLGKRLKQLGGIFATVLALAGGAATLSDDVSKCLENLKEISTIVGSPLSKSLLLRYLLKLNRAVSWNSCRPIASTFIYYQLIHMCEWIPFPSKSPHMPVYLFPAMILPSNL